jgi:hypothetical protein
VLSSACSVDAARVPDPQPARGMEALLPRLPPALCAAHLPADHGHRVTREGALQGLLTPPVQGGRGPWRFPRRMCPGGMAMCARGHGPIPLPWVVTACSRERLPGLPDAWRHLVSMGWQLPLAWRPVVSNDLLAVRALARVPRGSLRLSTCAGRPGGGAPLSTTACGAGPAWQRGASTRTQTKASHRLPPALPPL